MPSGGPDRPNPYVAPDRGFPASTGIAVDPRTVRPQSHLANSPVACVMAYIIAYLDRANAGLPSCRCRKSWSSPTRFSAGASASSSPDTCCWKSPAHCWSNIGARGSGSLASCSPGAFARWAWLGAHARAVLFRPRFCWAWPRPDFSRASSYISRIGFPEPSGLARWPRW